jgi:type III secretory pathway component EscV
LPVDVRFEWHADRTADWPSETVCRLLFDGCDSGFVRLPPQESAELEMVAARLAGGVFDARGSLVTPAVAQRLRREADAGADGGSDRLPVVRELVRRGLRPQRAWNAETTLFADSPESHYDRVIDQRAIDLRVIVPDLAQLNDQPGDDEPLPKLLELMDDGLFYELGLMLPPVEVEEDSSLAPAAIQIWVNDMPLPLQTGLTVGKILVNDTPDRLRLLGLAEAREAINPANGNPSSIVEASDDNIKVVKQTGLTAWGPAGYLVLVLSAAVRRYAGALWSVDSTDAALFLLRDVFPPLIEAVELRFDHALLTRVLRSLLDEEISVRNLSAILESMLAIDSVSTLDDRELIAFPSAAGNIAISHDATSVTQLQVNDWVTIVRIRLARYLSHKYTRGQATLIVYLLDPGIETEVATYGISLRAGGAVHALASPEGYLRLFRAIEEHIGALKPHDVKPVILTTQSVRPTLRRLISKDFPNVTVLCYQELSPEMNIQPIARISWS